MEDSPLITCLICTYRRPHLLARAIRSVQNQTFGRFQILVSDNASGDTTGDVVRRMQATDSRIIYHCHPENLGMYTNGIYAMSRVETPFWNLLSDDDVLLSEFYDATYAEFQKHPQAMVVAAQVFCVSENGRFLAEHLSRWDRMGLFEPPTGAHRVAACAHPMIPGLLFRREFLDTPYAYPDPAIHAGDYELILQTALHYPIVTIAQPGAIFVQHRGERARPSDPLSIAKHGLSAIRFVDEDDRFPQEVKLANRRKWEGYLEKHLRNLIVSLIVQGQISATEEALEILSRELQRRELASWLRLFHKLAISMSPLRPALLSLYRTISTIMHHWEKSRRPFLESTLRSVLKLD